MSIASSLFDRRGLPRARLRPRLVVADSQDDRRPRVAVEGLERITPGTTYVFVSNHQSIYDTPVIFASLPYQLRIIAKESLARFPVLGWHLKRGGHLLVDRPHPDRAGILKRWRALVSEGLSLIIYAEGTRSADGHVARFKAGSFLLAIEAGLPIVPMAVIGTRRVMPKGRLRTEPADVGSDHPRSDSASRHRCADRSRREAARQRVHDIVARPSSRASSNRRATLCTRSKPCQT